MDGRRMDADEDLVVGDLGLVDVTCFEHGG